jgi:hypothetical protein
MVDDLNNKFAFCDADDKPCTQENELFLEEISCERSPFPQKKKFYVLYY